MSRIYDKKIPQDLIKLGGTSMEWKFLDALVKELVEIMGLPEDNSIKNLLKHSLLRFLINDETMHCTRLTAEGPIPDPIYPRGLLNEYADYVLDKDKAWKEWGEAFNAEYKAKAAENGKDPKCGGVEEPKEKIIFKPELSIEELNTIIGYVNWLLEKKGKPGMTYIDNLPPGDHELTGANTDTERRKYVSCVLGNIAHFMQEMYPPDHKEAIHGTDEEASTVLLRELTEAEETSKGLILSEDEWIEAISKVGIIQRNLLKGVVPPSAVGLSILSRLRDVEEVLKLFINRLSKKDILQAMDYVSTIKLDLEQRNLGSLKQPESANKKPKRKYRGK